MISYSHCYSNLKKKVKLIKTEIRICPKAVNGIMSTQMNWSSRLYYEWEPSMKMLHTTFRIKAGTEERRFKCCRVG